MEELGSKLKNLFGGFGDKKFAGQGNRLGDTANAPPKPAAGPLSSAAGQPAATTTGGASSQQRPFAGNSNNIAGGQGGSGSSSGAAAASARAAAAANANIGGAKRSTLPPRGETGPVRLPSPMDFVLPPETGSGRATGTPPQPQQQSHTQQQHQPPQQQQQPPQQQQQQQPVQQQQQQQRSTNEQSTKAEGDEQLQHCLSMVLTSPHAAASLQTLARIINNVLASPHEPKFRTMRLGNAKIQETVVAVPGAVEFLQAAGFCFTFEEDSAQPMADAPLQGAATLPESESLDMLQEAWWQLQDLAAANGVTLLGPTPATLPAQQTQLQQLQQQQQQQLQLQQQQLQLQHGSPPTLSPAHSSVEECDRQTQVILPVTPDTHVPEYFFDATGADVREQYVRMVEARAAGELMCTSAHKQRLAGAAGGGAPSSSSAGMATATVRVRFPEGVCLQGVFGAREPVLRVHAWVCDALRDSAATYELVTPSRRPMPTVGTVRQADLAPSTILNFRPTGDTVAAHQGRQRTYLADRLLRLTTAQL
ncbi:MAG: hypothetical protein WDW38_004866 [Sanguina aurantia]